ncbi:MAG: alpha/beta hydrolase family protein [Planctomycetota bacterium]
MNTSRTFATFLLPAILLLTSVAATQSGPDPLVGPWRGTLLVGIAKLEVVLHIERQDDGYHATFDSVTQGARGIPVASLAREGDTVTAKLPRIGAEYVATFVAATDGAAARLDGTWKQGGRSLDLDLEPGGEKPLNRPQHPTGEVPYGVEEVAFGHDPKQPLAESFVVGQGAPVTLAATLTLPRGDGPHPVAVMISGSGPQDRDESLLGHKPFWVIADHLTRNGVAVLRYDDRGTAGSTGDFAAATSADFAVDARAALRYLRTRDDIDHARMGLIGHSEGGLIAPMVAAGPDRDLVAFAVLLAPPAVNIRDVITRQSALIGAAEGGDPDEVALDAEMSGAALAAVAANRDDAKAREAALQAIADEYWPKLPEESRKQVGGTPADLAKMMQRLNTPWMNWLVHHDPVPTLKAMRCEVLALFGGKDLQVEPAQNVPPLEAALAGRQPKATIVTIDGVNHLFQHTETGKPSEYGDLEETFAPKALQTIQHWLDRILKR